MLQEYNRSWTPSLSQVRKDVRKEIVYVRVCMRVWIHAYVKGFFSPHLDLQS